MTLFQRHSVYSTVLVYGLHGKQELPPFADDDSPTFSFDREIMSKKHLASYLEISQ